MPRRSVTWPSKQMPHVLFPVALQSHPSIPYFDGFMNGLGMARCAQSVRWKRLPSKAQMHAALRFCEEKVSGEELFKLINQVRWVADESGEHAKKAVGREPGQPGSEQGSRGQVVNDFAFEEWSINVKM